MKFDSDPWNDRRYDIMRKVLEDAGYEVLRGDEIRTSGNVVEEVCRRLEESSLVVIDTTGDSHNVSYELGFCHGIRRDPATTLLIRRAGSVAPFNYQHFRQLQYRDLRHLRRLLHGWLDVSIPLTADQLGYTLNIQLLPDHHSMYGAVLAEVVLDVLKATRFSGRCEYFAHDGLMVGLPDAYLVGLGLRPLARKQKLDYKWWKSFLAKVGTALDATESGLRLDKNCSEFNEMRAIRHWSMLRGVVECSNGDPVRILGVEDKDSWFASKVSRRLDENGDGAAGGVGAK